MGHWRRLAGAWRWRSSATLSINAASLGQTFIPLNAFGTNLAYWTGQSGLNSITPQMTALGSQFFRYPGGSSSDDYHWNGTGSFDGQSHWVPDDTSYGISWTGLETDRGTTSSYGTPSNLTDGDGSTRWLSNSDTDAPNAQWAYVDLGSAKTANTVSIDWSIPYATQFKVQYWNGAVGYPPPYGGQQQPMDGYFGRPADQHGRHPDHQLQQRQQRVLPRALHRPARSARPSTASPRSACCKAPAS